MIASAIRRYPGVLFQHLDMQDIQLLAPPFDFVFCIGNVAAHLPKNSFQLFLNRLWHLMGASGIWIVQIVNWDHILAQPDYRFPDKILDNGAMVFRRQYRAVRNDPR